MDSGQHAQEMHREVPRRKIEQQSRKEEKEEWGRKQ
jgi:hypothetical protein